MCENCTANRIAAMRAVHSSAILMESLALEVVANDMREFFTEEKVASPDSITGAEFRKNDEVLLITMDEFNVTTDALVQAGVKAETLIEAATIARDRVTNLIKMRVKAGDPPSEELMRKGRSDEDEDESVDFFDGLMRAMGGRAVVIHMGGAQPKNVS